MVGILRNQSSNLSCRSQTPTNSTFTGKSSRTNQRPKALAASRPIKPPPMIPSLILRSLISGFYELARLLGRGPIVHDGHQGAYHPGWIIVLNDIPPIDDPRCALLD